MIEKNINSEGLSVLVPCYNEATIIILEKTLNSLKNSLSNCENLKWEIIIINDGTKTNYSAFCDKKVKLINHQTNKGYGSALKTGIKYSKYEYIGITDSDNTYPNSDFDKLVKNIKNSDMIIGARNWKSISLIRRIPKWILTKFASFLVGTKIYDLNSGFRIFKKSMCLKFWNLYPEGFSFTSTITMSALTNGFEIKYIPIPYFKRKGKSHIKPFKDTIMFFSLVSRLALYFNPMKVFGSLFWIFLILSILRGFRDYLINGYFGGLTLILFILSVQLLFFGMLAQIINKRIS